MLIISSGALKAFKQVYKPLKGERRFFDSNQDMYRLTPEGDIYIHWYQETGEIRYTKNGAFVGNLFASASDKPGHI